MKVSKKYSIGGEVIAADFYVSNELLPSALVMHGAGQSDKSRTRALCENLLKNEIASVSLDFSGFGESTNNSPGSIAKRIEEASSILESMEGQISLFAFSMSGQVAVSLAEKYSHRIKNIILFCPAIYSEEALTIPFGESFSSCIRQEGSWKKSECAEKLLNFSGNLMVFIAENDDVIPDKVPEIILNSAIHAENKRKILVKNAPHTIGKWMNEHPERAEEIVKEIVAFLG